MPSLKGNETELQNSIQKVEQAASRISKQRTNLKHYRNVLRKGDLTSPASYKPLMRELFDDMKVITLCGNNWAWIFFAQS